MKCLRIASVVCLLIASVGTGFSQTPAEFFGRTSMRLIISADPGGSYDQIGRLLSRHLGKHIPGNPRVVPENMLGASGRVAANYLYHAAPKDGSVIGVVQQSIPMGQALGESGTQYDAARFNWIGSPVRLDETLVVWHTTGVRTIEDAKKKEVIIGATSPTGMNYVYPKLANELLGTKFKIVSGYPGGTPIVLALERGEVEGRGSNPWSEWKASKPDWVREGKIIALMQMSMFKHPDLPDCAADDRPGSQRHRQIDIRAGLDHRRDRPAVRDCTGRTRRAGSSAACCVQENGRRS